MVHGRQKSISDTTTIAVHPTPRLVAGQLSPVDILAVSE
jgi:hypothetical protein